MKKNNLIAQFVNGGFSIVDVDDNGVALTLLDDPNIESAKPNKQGDCCKCECFVCEGCKHYL